MTKNELQESIKIFQSAVRRLDEVLREDASANDAFIDASIQRFEFCFELGWKTLKRFLKNEGITTASPRDTLQEAFKLGWLPEGDKFWSDMIEDRNLTSHTYQQKTAMEVYQSLPKYLNAFQELVKRLKLRA